MPTSVQTLPIPLACRLVLDSVSYSNPLPPWLDGVTVGSAAKISLISKRINEYLAGQNPKAPFEILVPKKNGAKKRWLIPSVVDQIALQAAACGLARQVAGTIDEQRVFSYHYNRDPNRLQFCESQISSWIQFQDETKRRLRPGKLMLQFDLQAAFQSIPRPAFFNFLTKASSSGLAVDVLRCLLDSFSGQDRGLPLINDTIFFLGNAYFSVVDDIVRRQVPDFIRFVDDYRVFGDSSSALEKAFEKINRELLNFGFKVNMSKLKLGSSHDYLKAIGVVDFAETDRSESYVSAAIFDDVLEPKTLVTLIERVISSPEKHMNEGLGRLLIGAIRRLRLNDVLAKEANYPRSPADQFRQEMESRPKMSARAEKLLRSYAADGTEDWRAVWIAYVFSNDLPDKTRQAVVGMSTVSPLVRTWTRWQPNQGSTAYIEDLGYLEQGMKHYG